MKSPFKFLDAYDRQDKEIFFGRAEEIEQLYKLIFQTNLMLVYGQSGTGKTSLIQCGLANRFKPTDWFELFVRRKDNINISLQREIRRHAETPIADEASVAEAIQSLYLDHLRPVYLIFDQFEELFILGSKEEQQTFIRTIAALLRSEVACKIIIVMREEYLAMLYDFEKAVPALFNKRFRVETMNLQNVLHVITGTTAKFGLQLEKGEATAQQIIDNLSDHRAGVQLSYLQVYLDKLYREAVEEQNGKEPIIFTERLVQQTGALGDVMADFLEEQAAAIQKNLSAKYSKIPTETVQLILEEFATLEGTKQPITHAELAAKLQMPVSIIESCLAALEKSRILRHIEGVYELAHDTLAGRIAEKRSVESKNLLKATKLIQDRQSAYEQTRSWLNKEELNYIAPYSEKLRLSPELKDFWEKSKAAVRRRTQAKGTLAISTIAIILGFAGFAAWQWQTAKTLAYKLEEQGVLLQAQVDQLAMLESAAAPKQETISPVETGSSSPQLNAPSYPSLPSGEKAYLPSGDKTLAVSENFLEILMQWEGVSYNLTRNNIGRHLTIGAGHLLMEAELTSGKIRLGNEMVDYRKGLADDQILKLLKQDLKDYEKVVNDSVKVPLTQNQFEALVSFAFNIGISPFHQSTLLKRLNQRQYDEVPVQMRRWVKLGNTKIDDLIMRRKNEIALWNGTLSFGSVRE